MSFRKKVRKFRTVSGKTFPNSSDRIASSDEYDFTAVIAETLRDAAGALLHVASHAHVQHVRATCEDGLPAAPDDDVDTLMGLMTQRRCRHIPVKREGALCGVISIGDLVKNRLEEVEREASQLREYIARG